MQVAGIQRLVLPTKLAKIRRCQVFTKKAGRHFGRIYTWHLQRCAKCFRFRVAIHHPLGFVIGTPLKVLVSSPYSRPIFKRAPKYPMVLF